MLSSFHHRTYPSLVTVLCGGLIALSACQSSPEPDDEAMIVEPSDSDQMSETEHPQGLEGHSAIPEEQAGEDPHGRFDERATHSEADEIAPPSKGEEALSAESDPSQPPPSASAPDAPDAQATTELPSSPDDVTQSQVEEFASVYIDVMQLQLEYEPRIQQATDPEQAQQMAQQFEQEAFDAVESHDLTLDEFHAIAHLLENDESLRDRIQSEVDEQALME